jgi:hypothetical protein
MEDVLAGCGYEEKPETSLLFGSDSAEKEQWGREYTAERTQTHSLPLLLPLVTS